MATRESRSKGGHGQFFEERTKKKVRAAVAEIEARSSAEIVVSVERISGFYRHADYLGGLATALLALATFLYSPEPFTWTFLPLELALAFGLGTFFVASVDGLRRRLVGKALLERNVRRAAKEAFFDLGMSKTRGRSGVLVFLSAFERRVQVIADVGVSTDGSDWKDATQKLDRAVRLDVDAGRFVTALEGLGDVLARLLPRADDDENELPDDLQGDEEEDEDDDEHGPGGDDAANDDEGPEEVTRPDDDAPSRGSDA